MKRKIKKKYALWPKLFESRSGWMTLQRRETAAVFRMTSAHRIERMLIGLGTAFCVVFVVLRLYGALGSRLARTTFEAERAADRVQTEATENATVDFSLWSEKRIRAYQDSLASWFTPPLALLEIPRIHLIVPVFNGTDETVLNRGVGRIIGTARIGAKGNLGIAGHRDGFFRALKDLEKGDEVDLVTADNNSSYEIDSITIVTPENVGILADRTMPTLTLVTCYPFYFVGDAPQRYILQCALKKEERSRNGGGMPSNQISKTNTKKGER